MKDADQLLKKITKQYLITNVDRITTSITECEKVSLCAIQSQILILGALHYNLELV